MKHRIDPRSKNEIYSLDSVSEYLSQYADRVTEALNTIAPARLQAALDLLKSAQGKENHVFALGNGGSSAIADHLCCDWTKGTHRAGEPRLRTLSATSNTALFTALSNDYGYENAFASYLEMHSVPGDVVVLISSSGNSENILKAAETTKSLGLKSIGMTGFLGGKLGNLVDVHLHVPVSNYGVVEDCHQTLMHVLAQYLDASHASPRP